MPCSYRLNHPENIKCTQIVTKRLPSCEHSAEMPCSSDPAKFDCRALCNVMSICCNKPCAGRCGQCQVLTASASVRRSPRTVHQSHPCRKLLHCQHSCVSDCKVEHDCSDVSCGLPCQQRCTHRSCNKKCSELCTPCVEPCEWQCSHHACPVACGAVSSSSLRPKIFPDAQLH